MGAGATQLSYFWKILAYVGDFQKASWQEVLLCLTQYNFSFELLVAHVGMLAVISGIFVKCKLF